MVRINLFIDDSHFIQLKGMPGTISEHVRVAIREYLKNLYNVSSSESKRKGVQEDG